MPIRTRLATLVVALVALAAVPAVANAGTVPMRGVVSGSPYGASQGQMAIPVLFSKQTARNVGLKSPVGVIVVKRTQKVRLPNGAGFALPVQLRTGDRFKGFGQVGALQRRVFYPRVVFGKPVVYFRSKELSLAELSAAVDSLRKALANLQAQLNALQGASIAAFQDLYKQLADLKNQLASLKLPAGVDLSGMQAQIDALGQKLDDLIAGLPDFSKYATLTDLTSALAGYYTKSQVDAKIQALQDQVDAITGVLPAGVLAGTQTLPTKAYVDSAVQAVQDQVTTICTSLNAAMIDPDGGGALPAIKVFPSGVTGC